MGQSDGPTCTDSGSRSLSRPRGHGPDTEGMTSREISTWLAAEEGPAFAQARDGHGSEAGMAASERNALRWVHSCGRIATMDFWQKLDALVDRSSVIVDRPKGSAHPHYPSLVYPLDYGFLEGTRSADGEGIDVWIGSLDGRAVTGILCTVNLGKRESEIKILLGCTEEEGAQALAVYPKSGLLVSRSEGMGRVAAEDRT